MRTFIIILSLAFCAISSIGQTGYVQEGKASFYADKFDGRTTASGERYSHSKSTCAHLSLPFGTLVRVTNLSNGSAVVVRVNDRGPFVPNRIIDLSRSAAEKLGFIDQGIADVRIEVIDESGQVIQTAESKPKPAEPKPTTQPKPSVSAASASLSTSQQAKAPEAAKQPVLTTTPQPSSTDYELYELNVTRQSPGGFTVQIGSYKELANLLRIADDLKSSLKKEVRVQVATINGEKVYRLMVGQFSTRREAEAFREKTAKLYPDCFVLELK
jgi:rare lipoprotein A